MNYLGLSIDNQVRLLHQKPSRQNIFNPDFKNHRSLKINVFRNEALEPTLNLAERFLSNFNIQVNWNYGPYDDTLMLTDFVDSSADANLVWLDWRRIPPSQLNGILDILSELAGGTGVIPNFVLEPLEGDSNNVNEIKIELSKLRNVRPIQIIDQFSDEVYRDSRLINRNGTDLSNKASFAIAQALGLQALPELVLPILKCLVLDLDNTLYSGVLGEDGVFGVEVTEAHQALGLEIKRLKSQGLFIAVASKNEQNDVFKLFELRPDLPINLSDISIVKANWGLKSNSIIEIASELNIGTDSIALLDDNPVELSEVSGAIPEVYTIYAPTPHAAIRSLRFGPRTSVFSRDSTEGIRAKDVTVSSIRNRFIERIEDPLKLHKTLDTRLKIQTGNDVNLERAQDLFLRTNQFNVALQRIKIDKVKIHEKSEFLATASLTDKYSDSGVISALHGKISPLGILIDEFVISCRALGRKLETVIFIKMLNQLAIIKNNENNSVYLMWQFGPRNAPSLNWLEKELGLSLKGGAGTSKIDFSSIPINSKLLEQIYKD